MTKQPDFSKVGTKDVAWLANVLAEVDFKFDTGKEWTHEYEEKIIRDGVIAINKHMEENEVPEEEEEQHYSKDLLAFYYVTGDYSRGEEESKHLWDSVPLYRKSLPSKTEKAAPKKDKKKMAGKPDKEIKDKGGPPQKKEKAPKSPAKERYTRAHAFCDALTEKEGITKETLPKLSNDLYVKNGGKSNVQEAKAWSRMGLSILKAMGLVAELEKGILKLQSH